MRLVDTKERKKLKNCDLFHIPLNKRGIVKTQRYSVPGLPCIYLGKSIYGCWEEMGRPDFGTVMASRFEVMKYMKVLDLRIPDRATWDKQWTNYILFMPIIIASMIQVNNPEDIFKPEYIVPQLLTEWVVSQEKREEKDSLKGIIYTSVMKNNDFNFPVEKYDNIAIPTIKNTDKKYCSILASIFKVTDPTYYNLECLKKSKDRPKVVQKDNQQQLYNSSDFAMMENYLQDLKTKPVNP